MKKYITYRDAVTGYEIRQYTQGPERNTKLYFTTENFTVDDRFFFCNRQIPEKNEVYQGKGELYKVEVETGEMKMVAGSDYRGFAMDRFENYGVMTKGNIVCRYECDTDQITEIGALPEGGNITGHLTISRSGLIVCGYKQRNCIYALVIMDRKQEKRSCLPSDYNLGHTQVCPTDDNFIFFVHETGGDALQRMWLFDRKASVARPYYVEMENEWITHEVWTADGKILFYETALFYDDGDEDGHSFRVVARRSASSPRCIPRFQMVLCRSYRLSWC